MLKEKKEYWENGNLKTKWHEDENGLKQGIRENFKKTGELFIKSNYKDGQLHGNYIVYYENGNILREVEYKNDKKEGIEKVYYSNKTLSEIYNYKNGQLEGEFFEYHESGNLSKIGQYKDGKKEGEWKKYQNNNLIKISNYKEGLYHGEVISYYLQKSGLEKVLKISNKCTYIFGKKEGIEFTYYPNGQLKKEETFHLDNKYGVSKSYYENGQLKEKGRYFENEKIGIWEQYDTFGNKNTFEYKKFNLIEKSQGIGLGKKIFFTDENYKKQGIYIEYNSNNEPVFITNYKDDKNNGITIEFDVSNKLSNPKVLAYTNYKEGNLDGEYKQWYENGNLKIRSYYKDGKEDGVSKSYYENGNIEQERIYDNNLLLNRKKYYSNGQLKEEELYDKGHRIGVNKEWYENGNLKYEENYKNYKEYYENGQLKEEHYENLHRETTIKYFENGEIDSQAHFINGKREGINIHHSDWDKEHKIISNYQNGLKHGKEEIYHYFNNKMYLMVEVCYKEGKLEGDYKTYYPNGKSLTIGQYEDNLKKGKWIDYYENGNIKTEGNYKNGKIEGTVIYYYENGNIEQERTYKNNILDNRKSYYLNGQLKESQIYSNQEKNGEYKEYYENGQLKLEENKKGFKSFDENGKLLKETSYEDEKPKEQIKEPINEEGRTVRGRATRGRGGNER